MDSADLPSQFIVTPQDESYINLYQKVPNYGYTGQVQLTWETLEDNPIRETQNSEYSYTTDIINITEYNKGTFSEYEIGDKVFQIIVKDKETGQTTTVYTVIGKDSETGIATSNRLPESNFDIAGGKKYFREGDFINNVAIPINTLFSFLKKYYGFDAPSTFYIANLPDGEFGKTAGLDKNVCTPSPSDMHMLLNTKYFINPTNSRYSYSSYDLAMFDRMVLGVTAHESFHAFMGKYGIYNVPSMRIGGEAFANALEVDSMSIMRFFYKGPGFEDADSTYNLFLNDMAIKFYLNHIIDMSTTGDYKSGYEHLFLIKFLMQLSGKSWESIFSNLRGFINHCDPNHPDTPSLIQVVFNEKYTANEVGPYPIPDIYMSYLGHMLQSEGSEMGEIFDRVRKEFRISKVYQLGEGNVIQITPKNFVTFHITSPLEWNQYLTLVADSRLYGVKCDSDGRLLTFKGGDIIPYNKNDQRFTILNTSDQPLTIQVIKSNAGAMQIAMPIVIKN